MAKTTKLKKKPVRRARKPAAGKSRKAATAASAGLPEAVKNAPPATAVEPVVRDAPGKSFRAGSRPMLGLALITVLLVLTAWEAHTILKGKIARQTTMKSIQYFGERGTQPDAAGRFWSGSRLRVDDQRKRLIMTDSLYCKVIYWDSQKCAHLIDLDKGGRHQLDAQGNSVRKDFKPENFDVDGAGNVYVLDKTQGEVTVFDPDFKVKGAWTAVPSGSIAVGPAGQIYILDPRSLHIIHYSSTGQELRRIGKEQLMNPGAMAVDEQGELYVVDQKLKQVLVFSPEGKLVRTFAPDINPFVRLEIDIKGRQVYVYACDASRLLAYTPAGELLWGANVPYTGVFAVDADGVVFLAGTAGVGKFSILPLYK